MQFRSWRWRPIRSLPDPCNQAGQVLLHGFQGPEQFGNFVVALVVRRRGQVAPCNFFSQINGCMQRAHDLPAKPDASYQCTQGNDHHDADGYSGCGSCAAGGGIRNGGLRLGKRFAQCVHRVGGIAVFATGCLVSRHRVIAGLFICFKGLLITSLGLCKMPPQFGDKGLRFGLVVNQFVQFLQPFCDLCHFFQVRVPVLFLVLRIGAAQKGVFHS